jgi:hypothetical protein
MAENHAQPPPDPGHAALKRRFKERCKATNNVFQNWQIRVHRSLSWSARAATLAESHPEAEVLYLWIAFNSLYGLWDAERNCPGHDHDARRGFIHTFAKADKPATEAFLQANKATVKKLLGSPYLSGVFWRDPHAPKAAQLATTDLYKLDSLMKPGDSPAHAHLIDLAFERVYIFRGQLVHGASTGGSRLNRPTLTASLEWLRKAVPFMQHLAIEFGTHDTWPELCYPPIDGRR